MTDTIRPAGPDDLGVVVDVLTLAFLDDPWMAWAFPDDARRPERLRALWVFMARDLYLPAGRSTLAPDGEAAALWRPPGFEVPEGFWAERGPAFVEALGGEVERIGAMGDLMRDVHPREPHWYLLALGVRPEVQGRGLGSALLAATLAVADERQEAAYLEATSTRSRTLYERFGFEVLAELSLEDSPSLWAMWRAPSPPR